MASYTFGQHVIKSSVVFFRSRLTFAFVNRKPVLPGHVLVSPVRPVERFLDMTGDEVADLFQTTQTVSKVIQDQYKASSLSIAMQDGPDAGQSVWHVHVHILPRKPGDFKRNDDIYDEKITSYEEMNMKSRRRRVKKKMIVQVENHDHVNFDSDSQSEWRGDEEMSQEAGILRNLFPSHFTSDIDS